MHVARRSEMDAGGASVRTALRSWLVTRRTRTVEGDGIARVARGDHRRMPPPTGARCRVIPRLDAARVASPRQPDKISDRSSDRLPAPLFREDARRSRVGRRRRLTLDARRADDARGPRAARQPGWGTVHARSLRPTKTRPLLVVELLSAADRHRAYQTWRQRVETTFRTIHSAVAKYSWSRDPPRARQLLRPPVAGDLGAGRHPDVVVLRCTCARKRSSAGARPGRPTIRQCRPTDHHPPALLVELLERVDEVRRRTGRR